MELLRDRGTQEGMATVHIFNTFFYPQVMSRGHAGVKRWTKRVDIFGVDLILIPVHLGMHWCLAVSRLGGFNDEGAIVFSWVGLPDLVCGT